MAQVIVYGRRASLDARRQELSDAIHGAVVAALDYPAEKRFHRFVGLDTAEVGIAPHSVEITITETPKVNWGIRGVNAEDLALGYRVDV